MASNIKRPQESQSNFAPLLKPSENIGFQLFWGVQKSNNPLKLKHVVKFERLIDDIMFSHLVESNLVSENQSGNSGNSWINQLMNFEYNYGVREVFLYRSNVFVKV